MEPTIYIRHTKIARHLYIYITQARKRGTPPTTYVDHAAAK